MATYIASSHALEATGFSATVHTCIIEIHSKAFLPDKIKTKTTTKEKENNQKKKKKSTSNLEKNFFIIEKKLL